MGYRMVEAEHISMQAKTTAWIIAITILNVTTNWVSHIGSMHTNLVLSTRLQLIFHQRMLCGALQGMEMGNGVLAAIVRIAGISDKALLSFSQLATVPSSSSISPETRATYRRS